jgi:predicted DNA-binding protein with PD1-like motif
MEYKKIGETYYIRMDRGDEIIGNILEICRKESIPSAIFSGIGGCSNAELQVFIPESGSFETETIEGMLELVSLNGNVVSGDDGQLYHHTHALFSFKGGNRDVDNIVGGHQDGQHGMAGGHLKSTTVLYTAEIELRPTIGGSIGRKFDPETGTGFWNFK